MQSAGPYSSPFGGRASSALIAALTSSEPSISPWTQSAIGMSTPRSRANSVSACAVNRPSARPPRARFGCARAASERQAKSEIARLRRGAGQNEIAEPGKTHQRRSARPESLAKTAELGETAGGERGDRARAKPAAGGDAAGDRQHVLRRAADLDAANVGRMIEAQSRPAQRVAERPRQLFVGRRERHRGRQARRNVGGEGRSGENGPGSARARLRAKTSVMNACVPRSMPLAQDTSAADPGSRRQPQRDLAARLGRRRHQNRVAPAKLRKIGCRLDRAGQINAGQPVAAPCRRDGAYPGLIAAPEDRLCDRPPPPHWPSATPQAPAPATPMTFAGLMSLRAAFGPRN